MLFILIRTEPDTDTLSSLCVYVRFLLPWALMKGLTKIVKGT